MFASGSGSIERNSLSSWIHLIRALVELGLGKRMKIKYSVPGCGVGVGDVGARPDPGQGSLSL